jgi:hypothetical protein
MIKATYDIEKARQLTKVQQIRTQMENRTAQLPDVFIGLCHH